MKLLLLLVLAVGALGARYDKIPSRERTAWAPSKPRGVRTRGHDAVPSGVNTKNTEVEDMVTLEREGKDFLAEYDRLAGEMDNKVVIAEWGYESNITDHNLQEKLKVSAENAKFQKEQWAKLSKFPWRQFKDEDLKRRFKLASVLGTAALQEEDFAKYEETVSEMQTIYSKAKICSFTDNTKCDLALEPELTELLMKSRDPAELSHIWVEWRRATGEKVRSLYKDYVALSNKAGQLNSFPDATAMWLRSYEAADFKDQVSELWDQLKPLYQQLHAYVRRHLRQKYGESAVSKNGPIPAHLLGNMWSQTWGNVADFMMPYPDRQSTDVTPNMIKQGYTPLKMFKLSEQFFTSLNLSAMPEEFWQTSILEKPEDGRDLVCHASAWDFYDAKDFRIKQCTRVTQKHFYTAHHEMGHIQYFLQYKHQPIIYRTGANPGFHEAVGDVMSLSVSTPKHLKAIGLLDESSSTDKDAEKEAMINHLFSVALDKIAFLPFAYMLDLWRWDVFEGRTHSEEYNCHWWKLREQYQGVEPPVDRTEEDFDPASKYHVVASVPYIRYFVSFVIQFQFHRSLCLKAGQLEGGAPLHECDIYKSTEAGNLLGDMLQLGASKAWPDAMELVTGQRRMDASALREYFAPLESWLKEENEKSGETIGWEPSKKICVQSREELSRIHQRKASASVETPTESTPEETVSVVTTPKVVIPEASVLVDPSPVFPSSPVIPSPVFASSVEEPKKEMNSEASIASSTVASDEPHHHHHHHDHQVTHN